MWSSLASAIFLGQTMCADKTSLVCENKSVSSKVRYFSYLMRVIQVKSNLISLKT